MYEDIVHEIKTYSAQFGRTEIPELIAVSKRQPLERVKAVLDAGQTVFGENQIQEAQQKWPALKETYQVDSLHLLGPLQSNKVSSAVEYFDVIHSLDRVKIAEKLAQKIQEHERNISIFIQVNIGNEPQKSGLLPNDLRAFLKDIAPLDLNILGLMCIPPNITDPSEYFQDLRLMAHDCGLAALSMGMSHDFPYAIKEGATHLRIGSAIFGARNA